VRVQYLQHKNSIYFHFEGFRKLSFFRDKQNCIFTFDGEISDSSEIFSIAAVRRCLVLAPAVHSEIRAPNLWSMRRNFTSNILDDLSGFEGILFPAQAYLMSYLRCLPNNKLYRYFKFTTIIFYLLKNI
jgi:hypothetical protein